MRSRRTDAARCEIVGDEGACASAGALAWPGAFHAGEPGRIGRRGNPAGGVKGSRAGSSTGGGGAAWAGASAPAQTRRLVPSGRKSDALALLPLMADSSIKAALTSAKLISGALATSPDSPRSSGATPG